MRKSFSSLLFVLLVGGCAASGSARYSASATTPRLVYVSEGVQVIEDYDEPIFYSSNMYWRYDGGVWYQSRYHTNGWVRVSSPPPPILRIEQPAMYVHYHASAHATAAGEGQAGDKREIKEDKREMKEENREVKDERREAQQEKREDKHEDKQDKRDEKQEKHDDKQDNQDAKPAHRPGNDNHKPAKK
jgi:hypothetical protein